MSQGKEVALCMFAVRSLHCRFPSRLRCCLSFLRVEVEGRSQSRWGGKQRLFPFICLGLLMDL